MIIDFRFITLTFNIVILKAQDLIGKTIIEATIKKLANHDDSGYLQLKFSDGSECLIISSYGMYTGDSADEYPTLISIVDKFESKDGETLIDIT